MARKPKGPKTITDNKRRKTKRWIVEHRGRGARVFAVLALLAALGVGGYYALRWADDVETSNRPTLTTPTTPRVRGTSPVEAAKVTGAATERAAGATAETNLYSADRAAEATDRTGRRTFVAALGAGLLALASVVFNGLMWRQTRIQHGDERRRADRLHVTDMLDKAAGKLSDDNDAARTLAIHTLERVYNDASLLHDGSAFLNGSPTETLQRAVIETLCGYVRDLSYQDYNSYRLRSGVALNVPYGAFDTYRSPNSIKAAISVLGRCKSPPPGTVIDLDHSWLSDVDFRGSYGDLRLSNGVFGRISISADVQYLSAGDCMFKGKASFWTMDVEGGGSFSRSVFEKPVSFEGVRWRREVVFDSAEFHDSVNFHGMQVDGLHALGRAKYAKRPDFDDVRFTAAPPNPVDEWWEPFVPPSKPVGS